MVEEPVKSMTKKDLVRLDEEIATKLQAKFNEEERPAREKYEANLAQRLQAQEQEELTDEEKARLFVQFLEQRRKHFAAKRAEEKRNKPPTQAQQRKIMCTYLKNMEGKKPKDLKNKSFDSIQKMFDKAFKRVNTFVDYRTELVEESSKKAETELKENLKKAEAEVMEDEEEVAIDVVPLATKPSSIVVWKIHKEGKKSYYQIIRADGKSQMYRVFSQMLKSFSREDLEDLYKLVKAKYGSTRPVEDLDLILYGDLKTMFKPHVEDQVWKNQDDYKVLDWNLYDSRGVHSLRMQHVYIHMLVEKRYTLKLSTITNMLNKKLFLFAHHYFSSRLGVRIFFLSSLISILSDYVMSPPIRKKFRWGIAIPSGLKRYTDPATGFRMRRTNRKCRIPIDLYPCRVEEKLIMRKLEGKWIMKEEMRMISKDGTISEFPGYTSSKEEKEEEEEEKEEEEEEEEEEEKEESEKKGSKEASEMGSNSESSGYAASDNEVELDLDSIA
ncbi:hypothetical protein Tco_0343918 [Tanacetum coccineum]